MRYAAALMLSFALARAVAAQTAPVAIPDPAQDPRDAKVFEAIAAINTGDAAGAIAILDPVLAAFDAEYSTRRAPIMFCAGNPTDTLARLGAAATVNKDAIALRDTWCYALWAKGLALAELRKFPEAIAPLERAVAMMPEKPEFQSELGYVHQALKHFDRSSAAYASAAEAAQKIEDIKSRNFELRRAWFGMAYAEIEFGHLDKAETLLKKALEVAPGDAHVLNELEYIKQQRAKKPG